MEILVIGAILLFIFFYNNTIDKDKFIADNEKYLEVFREEDYNFLLYAKYGDEVDVDAVYMKRAMMAVVVFLVVLIFTLSSTGANVILNIVISLAVAVLVFKMQYRSLKSFYKKHLNEIDVMLPYYLKSLEILIQHYTVPVALGKSIPDAPEIFRSGLIEMINKINAGDATVTPYMEFAQTYPVRDSMRMMRLLYRLSLGRQERKQEQLITFSKTISNLQQKARETRYKERLDKMESKTMNMLVCTGVGVMILLLIAVMNMIGS